MAPAKKTSSDSPTLFNTVVHTPAATPEVVGIPEHRPLLMVMDGHAMLYRAFFALQSARPMTLRDTGEDVRGVYSFTTTFFKIINELKPTHVAITFDPPGPTFRHEQFEEYKANRPHMPDELAQNIVRAKQMMQAFDVPIYEVPGYEADDVLGTIATYADTNEIDTVITTGDTDTLQLVSDNVRVLLTTGFGDNKLYDPAMVAERYSGLEPDQVRDVKALTGDSSDNIPGVPGVGIKTAIKLIQEFGSVESMLDRTDEIQPPRIQGLVREHTDTVRRAKQLVTIERNVPTGFELDAARFGTFSRNDVVAMFQELAFSSLVARIPKAHAAKSEASSEPTIPTVHETDTNVASVTIVDDAKKLDAMLAGVDKAEMFAFEAHTNTVRAMEAALVGIGIAFEPGTAYYVPLGHESGKQLLIEDVIPKIKALLQRQESTLIGHNLNFALTHLSNYGISPTSVCVGFDSMIAAHLLGEKSLGLKQLAFTRLNIELKALSDITGTGKKQLGFDAVPITDAAEFACANVNAILALKEPFTVELERDGLTSFNRDYSMPLIPVLVQLQVNGISLDSSVLAEMDKELVVQIEAAENGAYEAVAHQFAINSPQQLGELLFDELKLPAGKKTKTGYSTDASILENLRHVHPVINHVLDYRALTKLKSTYVDTLPLEVNPRTHRIHTTYNQAGSATGRLASNDPNLQNIPVRTQLGQRVRSAFIAERRPSWLLLSADYSQIDLRALAHLSQDPELMAAFERDEDIHKSTASLIYGVPLDEVTLDMRRLAKVMNFGVAYGLSAFGISRQTEMTMDEGGRFIADYFGTYPKVREYLDKIVETARELGYAETLLGRRRYLPELRSPHYPVRAAGERMALNMPVQGTSSDIINSAMVSVQNRLENEKFKAKMLLQVHDELVFELPVEEEAALSAMLHETMPSALSLSVALKIDIKAGDTWADMHTRLDPPAVISTEPLPR